MNSGTTEQYCPFDFMTSTQNWIEFKIRTLGYGEDPQVVTDRIRDRVLNKAAKDIARVMNMSEQEARAGLDQVIQVFSPGQVMQDSNSLDRVIQKLNEEQHD